MIRQSNSTNRPLVWEDEAPAEPGFRRVQQGVPPPGRALPGMPLEMLDPDGDGSSRFDGGRFGGQRIEQPRNPWWRPASSWGRAFLGLGFLVVFGALAVSASLLKTYLGRDARFRIAGASNIEASGLTEVSRAEILPVFGEDIGRNIFFVPLAERRRQLEHIPWVDRATVMRLLPDQIRVAVVERQPVAFVRQGQQIGLVDSSGVLLTMPAAMMARHHYSFPVVTGIDPRDPLAARSGRMATYGRLMAELDANNQHFSQQISEIDLTDPENARVLMPEQGTDILAHFGEDHFLERYQRYKAHIAEWRQQYPKLATVDLRYEQQVVLDMIPGTGPAQTAAAETAKPREAKPHAVKSPEIAPGKSAAKAKNTKAASKPSAKGNQKPKSATAKETAEKDKRKRAEAKRAALEVSKHKPAATARPAITQGQGQ